MSAPTAVLIDAMGWLFRAYHALPPLTAPDGTPSGAVVGMNNMLKRLLRDLKPDRLAVVFDPSGGSFREELYAAYKANRDATPEALNQQLPLVMDLVRALGLPLLQVPGHEADDVIGTLAVQAARDGYEVLIVTSDKDMAQLVTQQVQLLDTMKNRRMDPAGVVEKFGVPPERIIELLALMGDSVDNIPGVPLVGPKTAAKWLNQYGSLDALMAAAEQVPGKAGENLRASRAQIPVARRLATITLDVPLDLPLDSLVPQAADEARLHALYTRLGMRTAASEVQAAQLEPVVATGESGEAVAEGVESPRTQAELVLLPEQLSALVAALQGAELISFDTETDALDANAAGLVGLSFAVEEGRGWYVPVAHRYLDAPEQLPMETVLDALRPVLEDPQRPKLAQHAKYDINVLARHGIAVHGLAYDTMLESYVLDAAAGRHDMDTLAERWLQHRTIRFSDVAGKGKAQLSFAQVELVAAAAYAAEDADITLRLHNRLYPRLQAEPRMLAVFRDIEMPLVPVLTAMEAAGVKVDVPLLRQISEELGQRMLELEAEAQAAAGHPFNLGSPKQLQAILFDELKLRVVSKTPKGDPSTAEEVLEELAAEHPLPRLILDWRSVQKLRSTYTENLPLAVNPRSGRIHTSYGQAVAATGRLSSSDPNLQNIPVRNAEGRRIRQAFIAEPGMALLSIDYSQIELRLMAQLSGDERLRSAFQDDLDIHQATAAEVFGLALDQVGSEQRRAAKAINFGLIYGMSAFGLARNLGIGRQQAAEYIERFFARYPGVRRYMDRARAQAHEQGYVETLRGRRLHLPQIESRNQAQRAYAERTAINAPLQGSAADLIKCAMIDLHGWLATAAPEVRMILQVHDELVFEGPEAQLRALAPSIGERMCTVEKLQVPLAADWGIGANWDAAHRPQGRVRADPKKLED